MAALWRKLKRLRKTTPDGFMEFVVQIMADEGLGFPQAKVVAKRRWRKGSRPAGKL